MRDLEEEVDRLLEEKGGAMEVIDNTQVGYAKLIAEREAQIDALDKNVAVNRK